MFGGIDEKKTDYVSIFMNYFTTTYIKSSHFRPSRWLHVGLKESVLHDSTNNTAESLNHILKISKNKTYGFEQVVKKIKNSIEYYHHQYTFLWESHKKTFSLESSVDRKRENKEKNSKNGDVLLSKYTLHKYN